MLFYPAGRHFTSVSVTGFAGMFAPGMAPHVLGYRPVSSLVMNLGIGYVCTDPDLFVSNGNRPDASP